MQPLPRAATDHDLLGVVERWAVLLEIGNYRAAYDATDHQPATPWSPDLIRQVIEAHGAAVPGQHVTVSGRPSDVAQRKFVHRYDQVIAGHVGYVWYDLNINGVATDLTATFDVRVAVNGLVLVLDDIRVMPTPDA